LVVDLRRALFAITVVFGSTVVNVLGHACVIADDQIGRIRFLEAPVRQLCFDGGVYAFFKEPIVVETGSPVERASSSAQLYVRCSRRSTPRAIYELTSIEAQPVTASARLRIESGTNT
jgi:hypothetical protein